MTGRIVTFAYTGPEALAAQVLRGLCEAHGVTAGPAEDATRIAELERQLDATAEKLGDEQARYEAAAERIAEAERQRDGWRAQHGEWKAEAERLAGRLAAITDEVNERRALTDRLVQEGEALKARLAEAEALAAERVGGAETGDAPAPPEAAAPQPEQPAPASPKRPAPAPAAPPRNAPALGNLVRVSTPLMTVTTRTGASFRVTSSLFCRALEVLADGRRAHLVTVARQAGFANGEALLNVARVNQKTLLRNGLALRVGGDKDSMIHLAEAS